MTIPRAIIRSDSWGRVGASGAARRQELAREDDIDPAALEDGEAFKRVRAIVDDVERRGNRIERLGWAILRRKWMRVVR